MTYSINDWNLHIFLDCPVLGFLLVLHGASDIPLQLHTFMNLRAKKRPIALHKSRIDEYLSISRHKMSSAKNHVMSIHKNSKSVRWTLKTVAFPHTSNSFETTKFEGCRFRTGWFRTIILCRFAIPFTNALMQISFKSAVEWRRKWFSQDYL